VQIVQSLHDFTNANSLSDLITETFTAAKRFQYVKVTRKHQ